jgi:hypothetical protein
MTASEFVTTAEAAGILGVSAGWVAALCRTGALTATGGGKGASWRITRSSVEQLAAERAQAVDPAELEDVARAIEEDQEAQQLANDRAEESFRDRVASIARRYGPGVMCVVAGVATAVWAPGHPAGPALIAEGLRELFRPSNDGGPAQDQRQGRNRLKSR